ncbi:hypothetical protein C8R44DRAFT_728963 [Mycena epipterygia]|nr:hypothetical protein C8R44DRAFT_728963 [Mycena epipterygia]
MAALTFAKYAVEADAASSRCVHRRGCEDIGVDSFAPLHHEFRRSQSAYESGEIVKMIWTMSQSLGSRCHHYGHEGEGSNLSGRGRLCLDGEGPFVWGTIRVTITMLSRVHVGAGPRLLCRELVQSVNFSGGLGIRIRGWALLKRLDEHGRHATGSRVLEESNYTVDDVTGNARAWNRAFVRPPGAIRSKKEDCSITRQGEKNLSRTNCLEFRGSMNNWEKTQTRRVSTRRLRVDGRKGGPKAAVQAQHGTSGTNPVGIGLELAGNHCLYLVPFHIWLLLLPVTKVQEVIHAVTEIS